MVYVELSTEVVVFIAAMMLINGFVALMQSTLLSVISMSRFIRVADTLSKSNVVGISLRLFCNDSRGGMSRGRMSVLNFLDCRLIGNFRLLIFRFSVLIRNFGKRVDLFRNISDFFAIIFMINLFLNIAIKSIKLWLL